MTQLEAEQQLRAALQDGKTTWDEVAEVAEEMQDFSSVSCPGGLAFLTADGTVLAVTVKVLQAPESSSRRTIVLGAVYAAFGKAGD